MSQDLFLSVTFYSLNTTLLPLFFFETARIHFLRVFFIITIVAVPGVSKFPPAVPDKSKWRNNKTDAPGRVPL